MRFKGSGSYDSEWFKDYDNVTRLGRHLASVATIVDAEGMVKYFEKPWKWSGEWDEMIESEGRGKLKPITCNSCGIVLKDHEFFTGISLRCPKCNNILRRAER